MSEVITRGSSVGLVPFLFGLAGRAALPGVGLRRLLGDLGLSDDAARALLSRLTRAGELTSERHGRTVDYRLAGNLARGFERIRTSGQAPPSDWSGSFAAVLYQVPEEHRAFRDALRRAAVLAGYGILQPGVLISMSELGTRLDGVLADRPVEARVWPARLALDVDDAAAAASIAWGLPELARGYHVHLGRLETAGTRTPTDPPTALRTYADTLMPILVETLREPRLPPALMPPDWPGSELRTAIGRYSAVTVPAFTAYVDAVTSSAGARERA
ncbi:PaaX family transcriptional regulator C-terminal domain-containing protein [Cryptosporangium arvum]|uniref:PaaX family transcriptional regulator C-terminal domain-containing protein n=1 Tax=Cryptosporangium arvum TaxID=80871 RepID=UPI0004AC879B|nr:PaaX family transcriptional regulator C-terminal domain-containing protein [Cryptosporangium arvum]